MITIRKLARLPNATRHRKIVRLLAQLEAAVSGSPPTAAGAQISARYWRDLLALLSADSTVPHGVIRGADRVAGLLSELPARAQLAELRFAVNDLRHALQQLIGAEAADWDLSGPAGTLTGRAAPTASAGSTPGAAALAGSGLYLERIRAPFNLGAISRAAAAFGIAELLLSPEAALPEHPRARRAAMGAFEMLALRREPLETVAEPVFALETGGTPIDRFRFPDCGTALIGSEELGLSPAALKRAEQSAGRVTIPSPGAKSSLNVAVAVGILLYCWHAALTGDPALPDHARR